MVAHMGLDAPEVISRRVLHPAEGSVFEVRAVFPHAMQVDALPRHERVVPLSDEEIESLLERAAALEHDQTCPHGRPTRVRMSLADLERAFHRR